MIGRLTGAENASSIPAPLEIWPVRQSGLDELVLETAFRRSLSALVENIHNVPGTRSWTLLLTGKKGSGRTAVAGALAGELRLSVVAGELTLQNKDEELKRIRRECRWHKAVPLVKIAGENSTAPDWRRLWLDLPVPCPVLFVELSPGDAAAALETHPDHAVSIEVPDPCRPERVELWSRRLPRGHSLSRPDLERLAARFAFSPGLVAQTVRRAHADLALRPAGERRMDFAAVSNAARALGTARMGAVAERLPLPFTFKDLVVPDEIREEFSLILAWVRHETRVLDEWGLGRRIPYGHGLAALLCGPPGTGKTMASQALARELDLDLYRVDLSQLMSKYIGETEKNLGRLFDEAHASGAVLFFDEADAIFGKRSEVKDARDRYANVEIGYLLQRMEAHDGVTLLATNRRQDMDEAFVRRFHSIVNFPMPSEQSRLRIWQGMLPVELEREPELDLPSLAKHFEISGGEIRNCVLAACYMAAAEGHPVGMPHLKRALRRELRKCGRFADEKDLRMLE